MNQTDQILGLGQTPDPTIQLATAMAILLDSLTGPTNGVKTSLDALSSVYNSTVTPPTAGSQAAILAQIGSSADVPSAQLAVTPVLSSLGQSLTGIDAQASTAAGKFNDVNAAATALVSSYQQLQSANTQLGTSLSSLYAAAGFTDTTTPPGVVAASIGSLKAQVQTQQSQITQLQAQIAQLQKPTPAPVAPGPVAAATTPPLFNTTTIIAGLAALAVIGGGIWWYTNEQKKKKQLLPMSQRRTMPSAAPMMGEQHAAPALPAARPARRSFPMSSRPNATARALMPRSNQARGGKRP